jgi:hypothetical protein
MIAVFADGRLYAGAHKPAYGRIVQPVHANGAIL